MSCDELMQNVNFLYLQRKLSGSDVKKKKQCVELQKAAKENGRTMQLWLCKSAAAPPVTDTDKNLTETLVKLEAHSTEPATECPSSEAAGNHGVIDNSTLPSVSGVRPSADDSEGTALDDIVLITQAGSISVTSTDSLPSSAAATALSEPQPNIEPQTSISATSTDSSPSSGATALSEPQQNIDPSRPYQPNPASIPSQPLKDRCLKFQSSWFEKFPWIHYSVSLKAVLCFTCSRANVTSPDMHLDEAFVSSGFRNWKKALEKFSQHQSSHYHHCSVTAEQHSMRGDSVDKRLIRSRNEQQSTSRRMLVKLITSLRFLARQGLAVRGREELNGNFMQLLKLRAEDSAELSQWMSRTQTFCSHDIQNELLQLMAHAVLREITTRIKTSGSFSVIVDGTQDCKHQEQESVCLRYLDNELKPTEVFVGLYSVESTTGENLARIILDALLRLDLSPAMLRGQAYDGAANMSGIYNGTQALIRQKYPLALFVHCGSHCTNLVAQHACEASSVVRDALSLINDLGVLVHQSGKAKATLLTCVASVKPGTSIEAIRPLCPTR